LSKQRLKVSLKSGVVAIHAPPQPGFPALDAGQRKGEEKREE
jgi:hypothetical protein